MNYTITEIATIVKAQKRAYKDYTITALLTDSRSLTFPEETLFFALVSERNDGHRYIKDQIGRASCRVRVCQYV